MKIHVQVPATTANLGPGFDALGLALTLWNEAEFSTDENPEAGVWVSIEGEGAEKLAGDASNPIAQAARAIFQRAGEPLPALRIRCVNRIPLGAGLGSSAAAILTGMLAANVLLGDRFAREELLQLAVEQEGHADNIAPALLGGLVVSTLADGRVIARKISLDGGSSAAAMQAPPQDLRLTIALPDFHFPTAQARRVLPRQIPLKDAVSNIGRAVLVVEALRSGDLDLLGEAMWDELHQPHRVPLIPGAQEAMVAARGAGAAAVALSGAGPGLIAFSQGQAPEIGLAMQHAFMLAGLGSRVLELGISEQGAQVRGIE